MRHSKYTCVYCELNKEPYFSRSEPMGFYCVECGHNFDEVDPEDFKEIKKQLATERALADRLAECLMDTCDSDIVYGYAPMATLAALAAWKEARNEI